MFTNRLIWIVTKAPYTSRRARLRGFWHYIIKRYQYEICKRCGRPVGPHIGSWWYASDRLWSEIIGAPTGVVCPPCFTAAGDAEGIKVCWRACRQDDTELTK